MAEGDPGDLAAAYVTILPDMDEFAADLAAKLEEITGAMRPTVQIHAELDLGGVEAELEAFASQEYSVNLGVDTSRLRDGLLIADGVLEAWANQDFKAKLGVDASGLRAALAAAADQEALPPLIQKIHVIPDPGGAATAGAIDQAVVNAMGGGGGGGERPQLSFLSPAANDAIGLATRDYLQHGIDNAVTKIAASALMNAKQGGVALTQDQVNELSGARTKIAAADTASEMGLSTVLRATQGGAPGGTDVGPFLADDEPANARWLLSLSQSLKGFGSQLGRSGLPSDVVDSYKPQMQDIANTLEGEVSKATAVGLGEELANMKRELNLKSLPYLSQGAEGTAGFFADAGEEATQDITPSDADLSKARTGLASLAAQIATAKVLSSEVKANLFDSVANLNNMLSDSPTSSKLDQAVADMTTLRGGLAEAKTAAILATSTAEGGGGPGLATLAAGAAGGRGGGGGFSGFVGSLFGNGADDASSEGAGIMKGILGFGTGHIPGSGVSRWIPAMPFLAGMGSLGSLAGFGPEHVITTLGGIAGSAVSGIGGAGLLGAGALGVAGVGFGTDLAGTGQALGDTKSTVTSMTALTTAVQQFGIGSEQAVTAAGALNQTLAGFSPIAQGAVEKAASMIETFKGSFDQATGLAEKYGAQIIQQAVKVGSAYLPVIGNFAAQNTLMIKNSLTGPDGLFNWLKSAQVGGGLDIFTQLEQTFQKGLPNAMGAATQGIEVFGKSISYLSTYTGGFIKELDNLFTKMNTTSGMEKWDAEMAKMIGNFETWKNFLKELAEDLHDIFKDDAGLGGSIIQTLTKMLTELNQWINSTKGHDDLTNLFTVHKEQVLALLAVIPGLVRALEPILHIMPAMTALTLPFINAIVDLLTALETIPGGVGPAVAAFLGFSLILGKTAGWGNAFGFLKTIFTGVVPDVGRVIAAMVGWTAAADGTTIAMKGLQVIMGGGALLLAAGAIYEVFHHFGTIPGIIAAVTVALIAMKLAMNAMGTSSILEFFTALWATMSGGATKLSADTVAIIEAINGQNAAEEGSAGVFEEAEAAKQAAIAKTIAMLGEEDVAADTSGISDIAGMGGVDVGAGVAGGAAARAGASAVPEIGEISGMAGVDVAAGLESAAPEVAVLTGSLAGLTAGLAGVAAAFAPVAIAAGVGVAAFALYKLGADSISESVKKMDGNLTNTATTAGTTLADLSKRYSSITEKMNQIGQPAHGGVPGWLQPAAPFFGSGAENATANTQGYDNLSKAAKTTLTQLTNLEDNTKYLSDRFHISSADADSLATSLGVNLTNSLSPTSNAFHKIQTAIQQMTAQAGIAASALFYLQQQSGETASQISNSMSQAASATQQLMDTLTNIPAGAAAFQQNAASAAATALSNAQQAQQLQQAITQAQQQYASDKASGAASVTSAAQQAAQPGSTPGGVAQAQTSAASQLQQDQSAITQAQTALSNFNATVAQSATATANALSIPPTMILQSMQANLASAVTFNQDIQNLMKDGFNPQVVNQIVTAGVSGGLATANGLLAGFVSNGGNAYVQQVNNAASALQQVSIVAIEQAKMLAVATLPKTKTSTALEEPEAMSVFNNMFSVNPNNALTGSGKVSSDFVQQWATQNNESFAKALSQLQGIAKSYGLTITGVVSAAAASVTAASPAVTAAATKTGTDAGKAAAKGAADGMKAATGPDTITGPLATSILGGHALLTNTGKKAGTDTANAVKDGGTAGAKPAGTALVDGIVDGVKGSQPALNKAVLASVKTSIDTDKSQVGGQSLGTALVAGIEAGISSSQTALNTAVIKSVKTAISADAGQVGGQSLGVALVNGIVAGISANAGKITSAMTSAVSGGISASQNLAANSPMPKGTTSSGGGTTIAPTYNMSVINAQGMNQTQLTAAIQQGVQQANAELLQLVQAHGG